MPGRDPGPSVRDPERYDALRRDGASREKAARIANTDATTAAAGGREVALTAVSALAAHS